MTVLTSVEHGDVSDALVRLIIAETSEPIFLFNDEGRLVFMNGNGAECLGVHKESLIGQHFGDMFVIRGQDGGRLAFDALRPGPLRELEGQVLGRRTPSSRILLTSKPLQDDAGRCYVLCFTTPVSRRDAERRHLILKRIASEIISVKPLSEMLDTVVRGMVEIAEVDHATITLIDEQRKNFVVEVEYPPREGHSLVKTLIPIKGFPTQESIVNGKEPVIVKDLASHPIVMESPRVAELAKELGTKSMAILPMIYRDVVIGTISVDAILAPIDFSDDEVEMYQTISNHAAVAIENARLLENAQSLQKLYSEAYSAYSLENVANRILLDLRALVEFQTASLQLIVNDRRILLGGSGFDKQRASPRLLGSIEHDPIVKKVLDSQQIHVIADTSEAELWEPLPETSEVRSWVGIPVVFKGKSVALLTLDHSIPGFYRDLTEDRISVLMEFAGRAAEGIHEAYLFDAAQRQTQSVALVNRVAEIVSTRVNAADFLQAITEEVKSAFECLQCKILLLDKNVDDLTLETMASSPPAVEGEDSIVRIASGPEPQPSPNARAYVTGVPVVVPNFLDAGKREALVRTPELPADAQSLVAVPIAIADKMIGVLVASHSRLNRFTDSDAMLLATIARHTGIAIERDTGLELVQRVGRDILRATSLEDILKEIVTGAIELTHTDSGVIYALNDNATAIVSRFSPDIAEHPEPRLDKPDGITRTVIDSGEVVEIEDISTDPRVNPALRTRFKSMVAIPMKVDTRVIGVLYLNGKASRTLSEIESKFVRTLADQAALVIQVRNSEAVYHSLVDYMPQRVFRKDVNSTFTSANAAFCKSLGDKELKDVIGKTDYDFYPKHLADLFVQDDKRVMQEGKLLERDELHQTITMERPIWVRVTKTPVLDAQSNITGVQAIFWEITEERELRERYRSLVEQSPDSIVLHKFGRITLANPAALRLFGVAKHTLLGRSIFEFLHPADKELARTRLESLNRNEPVDPMVEMRIMRGDEVVPVAVYARSLPGESEAQVVFHDLTGVNTLLGEMHHRVNRALSIVSGFLLTQEQVTPDPALTRVFTAIRNRIRAVARVHTILETQKGLRPIPIRTYFDHLIPAVVDCYGSSAVVTFDVVQSLALDEYKTLACGLIVTELVSNALLHAFPNGRDGKVTVRLTEANGHYELSVYDNGCGLAAEASGSRASVGLSLVKTLVAGNLRGTFDVVRSVPTGTGIVIRFIVPAQGRGNVR